MLVIGTELTSMASDETAWRELIERARSAFDGEITFAANWVERRRADRLLGRPRRDRDRRLHAARPGGHRAHGRAAGRRLGALAGCEWPTWRAATSSRSSSPELGYQSRVGTAARVGEDAAPLSESAQADAYSAAFEAMSGQEWFAGIWWWEWSAEGLGIGPDDGGWSPEGKQAALVLEDWQR